MPRGGAVVFGDPYGTPRLRAGRLAGKTCPRHVFLHCSLRVPTREIQKQQPHQRWSCCFCLRAIKGYFRVFGEWELSLRFPQKVGSDSEPSQSVFNFSSLFTLHSSLEKVAEENGEKREKRREKSEENKKKKPLTRLFLFGAREET